MNYENHINALNDMIKRYIHEEVILHNNQGSIYSSQPFNYSCLYYNIKHSMSKAGTPTDNLIIESINGWLKAEMTIDFQENNNNSIEKYIQTIIEDNNNNRPQSKLNYLSAIEYRIVNHIK